MENTIEYLVKIKNKLDTTSNVITKEIDKVLAKKNTKLDSATIKEINALIVNNLKEVKGTTEEALDNEMKLYLLNFMSIQDKVGWNSIIDKLEGTLDLMKGIYEVQNSNDTKLKRKRVSNK